MKKSTPAHWKVGKPEVRTVKNRLMEGLPVVDADHALVLNIKKCDIIGSKKADASNCAAARALKREIGSEAKVFLTRTYIKVGKKWQRFLTPQSISREITAFDRGAAFIPGEYTLTPPTTAQRLDFYRPTGKKNGSRPGIKRRVRHVTASVRKMK